MSDKGYERKRGGQSSLTTKELNYLTYLDNKGFIFRKKEQRKVGDEMIWGFVMLTPSQNIEFLKFGDLEGLYVYLNKKDRGEITSEKGRTKRFIK